MPSPLKDKPLRNPGQSIDEKLIDLAFDALTYITIALMAISITMFQWIQLLFDIPPSPFLWTIIAVIASAVAFIKIAPNMKSLKYLKQGRDGEKAVGQFLEKLRENGADVFHDIRGDSFNIDHVVISDKGIYVIETKTWTKPYTGKPTIHYDGTTFKKNGNVINPPPTEQAAACSKYLQNLLRESTGRDFPIQPIVTFPGWFVEHKGTFSDNTPWVLNPKVISKFVSNSKSTLTSEDAKLCAYHLSRHIRVNERAA